MNDTVIIHCDKCNSTAVLHEEIVSPPQMVHKTMTEVAAPASKPVLLQCLGCERVGTQEQLSASTDCDCWLHTQPAPVQEQQPVAWASQTAIDIAAEGGEGIIVGAEADCLIPLYAVPQPAPAERTVQEPVCRGCGIPINDIHMSTCPTKKWPMYVTPADAAQPEPVQEQQFTADELDLMRQWFESMQDTNRSFVIDADKKLHQKIIAAIQAAPRAEQPRKAVKLSDEEIKEAIRHLYQDATALQIWMDISLPEFRAIEHAVWAKLGGVK